MALDETAIRHIVLTELARQGSKYVPVGISARHVHLSQQDLAILFGPGYELTPIKPLVQPGQFAAKEQVTVVGPKGKLEKVRVLGPVRAQTQVEISMSDSFTLGVKDCPIRMSGNLEGTPGIRLVGPKGELTLNSGVIVAARHLHLSDSQARAYGIHNGQVVNVRVTGPRPCLMEQVVCRVGPTHELEIHVDTDEANACCLKNGDLLEVVFPGAPEPQCRGTCQTGQSCTRQEPPAAAPAQKPARPEKPLKPAEPEPEPLELVTEQDVNDAYRDNHGEIYCKKKAIVTPAAADRVAETGIKLIRV